LRNGQIVGASTCRRLAGAVEESCPENPFLSSSCIRRARRMTPDQPSPSVERPEEWDAWIPVLVMVHVTARPNPDYFEGWGERTPEQLALQAVVTSQSDPSLMDGFADLIGEAS